MFSSEFNASRRWSVYVESVYIGPLVCLQSMINMFDWNWIATCLTYSWWLFIHMVGKYVVGMYDLL